jgi:hypothetical protein
MAYNRLPADLATTLRKYGLKVVVVPGYATRGRPVTSGGFDPVGVLCHHTATPKTWSIRSVLNLLINGRSDLPGPLCQIGLGRDGTVYLIASGRANHGGDAKAFGTVAAGDANELYVGVEAFNDGVGEPWPKVQYAAYVLLCAALSIEVTKNSANTVNGHKETSVTGKIDPTFHMGEFRSKVAMKMGELNKPQYKDSRGKYVDHALEDLKKVSGKEGRLKKVQAAIAALQSIKPIK